MSRAAIRRANRVYCFAIFSDVHAPSPKLDGGALARARQLQNLAAQFAACHVRSFASHERLPRR